MANQFFLPAHTSPMRVQELDDRRGMPTGVYVALLSTGEYPTVIVLAPGSTKYRTGHVMTVRTTRLRNVPDMRPLGGPSMAKKRYCVAVDYAKMSGMAFDDPIPNEED